MIATYKTNNGFGIMQICNANNIYDAIAPKDLYFYKEYGKFGQAVWDFVDGKTNYITYRTNDGFCVWHQASRAQILAALVEKLKTLLDGGFYLWLQLNLKTSDYSGNKIEKLWDWVEETISHDLLDYRFLNSYQYNEIL